MIGLFGENSWKKHFSDNAYAITHHLGEQVIFRADYGLDPVSIQHELTHVVQLTMQKLSNFTGYPFKGQKEIQGTRDGNTEHNLPIEFFTYAKDTAVEVVNQVSIVYDNYAKLQELPKLIQLLRESNIYLSPHVTHWELVQTLFKITFTQHATEFVDQAQLDAAARKKFLKVSYYEAYKLLKKFAAKRLKSKSTPISISQDM